MRRLQPKENRAVRLIVRYSPQTSRARPVFTRIMKVNVKLLPLSLIALILWSCGNDEESPPPDITNISSPVALVRFDRELMSLDTADLAGGVAELETRHPEFTDVYLRNILPLRRGDLSPKEQMMALKAFLVFPLIAEVDSLTRARFPDAELEKQRAGFEEALRYYKYYLPDAARPDTLTAFFSQFELAAVLYGDGDMAAGLEFFLGPEYDYQRVDPRETIFSGYLARTYTPAHMTSKLMQPLIEDRVPRPRGGRLIDNLIYEGKKLYLLDKVLPFTHDSIIHEVTGEQMDWLKANEVPIYAHLQKEKHLYGTDPTMIKKYTQASPSTQGMPTDAPGRAVNFVGKRIVEAYVRANPGVTMSRLLEISDGQKILAGARYKPK